MKRASKITFIGYLDYPDSKVRRAYSLAAANKKYSLIKMMLELGFAVNYISISPCIEPTFRFVGSETRQISPDYTIRFFSSFGGSSILARVLREFWRVINYVYFLLFKLDKDDIIIFNHTLSNYFFVPWISRIRKFKYILECEEIYQDVVKSSFIQRRWEWNTINGASAYIFPTEVLKDKLVKGEKDSVIIYGAYDIKDEIANKTDDGCEHIVYAGTFDPRKGALDAINSAKYLPSNYCIHICGFGTEQEINIIQETIDIVSSKSEAKLIYEGCLYGEDYTSLLRKCKIGLCTQDPTASFTNTSFPSKVLSYMSNGLSVVAIAIPTLKESRVAPYLYFYSNQDAKSIADTILSVSKTNNNIEVVKSLRKDFLAELNQFLSNFSVSGRGIKK